MNNLVIRYAVSRSKQLLKRRRLATKKRPVSRKKLKEQAKHYNYAHQYKVVQIQKQLDRKAEPSQHVNELMDEIFYPDVRYANEQAAQLSIKLQNISLPQQDAKLDELEENILQQTLATQLLELYEEKRTQFSLKHLTFFLERFCHYFQNRQKIKFEYEQKWQQKMQTMKKRDYKFQIKKCPYLFLSRQDINKFSKWNLLIEDLRESVSMSPIQTLFVELSFCQLIHQAVQFIPSSLYETVLEKLLSIEDIDIFKYDIEEKTQILKYLNLKQSILYPIQIVIKEVDVLKETADRIQNMGKILCFLILSDPKCTAKDINVAFSTVNCNYNFFTSQLLEKAQDKVLMNISDLSFEQTVNILEVYLKFEEKNKEFLQIMKFDLYRKVSNSFQVEEIMRSLKLISQLKKSIKIDQLLLKICTNLSSKFMGTKGMQYKHVLELIDIYFENNVNDTILLEMVTNELMKNSQKLTLQELTIPMFKVYLLGHRSSIASKFLLMQFVHKYRQRMQRLKENALLFLPTEEEVKETKGLSIEEVHLEECLIMSLWMFLKTNKQKIPAQNLLTIYPLKINSVHPLPLQLSKAIYPLVSEMKLFPKIKPQLKLIFNEENKLNTLYGKGELSFVEKLLKMQANESQKFILNYSPDKNIFLREVWSDDNKQGEKYMNWLLQNPQSNTTYYNDKKLASSQLLKLRRMINTEIRKEKEEKIEKKRQIRYYDLY